MILIVIAVALAGLVCGIAFICAVIISGQMEKKQERIL